MKKKTVSGVTALTMLASATIPVYAAPIEEGVNAKGLNNPISTAKPAVDPMNVYTSFTETNSSNSGDGSEQSPYNRFEDAVAQVADGGTIYIKSDKGAFLNAQDEYGHLPFIIDKNITIKPVNGATNAELSVRTGGIILGADVTFENITLSFVNKYHDSIFVNGHTLNLINVTRGDGTRDIDVFAGGLYEREGNVDSTTPIYPIGDKAVINIETNDNFSGTQMSDFGNVYAGSMNGKFDGSVEINLSNNGKYKKLDLGAIKASGALEADAGNMFDVEEPLPPSENPVQYPVMNDVTINLHNYQISVDGTTGSHAKTNVSTSTEYPYDLPLKNVNHLTVKKGHITALYEESNQGSITIPNVTLENGATLDLTKAGKEVTVENYNGNGIVMLRKDGKLNITNPMNGSIELQTEGAFGGSSGLAEQDHVYITTPNEDANIAFTPHATQTYLELVGNKTDALVEWTTQEVEGSTKLAQINGFVIEDANAEQVKKYDEINKPNDMGGMNYEAVKFPFKALTDLDPDDLDAWVDLNSYPFEITVNGKKAVYREDENGIVGTHYFVEDLELALYFTSETYFDEHELVIEGYTKDGSLAPIKEGEYEIHVSHENNDGATVEFTSYLTVTNGEEPPTDEEGDAENSPADSVKQVYLSDLGYVTNQSNATWSPIKVNQNVDGGTIKLIVDGEKVEFGKGMGAHAPSNLVFDISQHSSEYTRLVAYMGVDASQGGNGDGVKFVISTSEDGKTWKELKTTDVVKGSNESIYVDLNIKGVKFVKLYANENGGNGNDHAVYGDLKLVKDDYSISSKPINGLQTVEEYDNILKNNTVEENMESHKMTILQRAFVDRVGYESLQRLAGKSDSNTDAINYIMNNETALNYFITGGPVNKGGSYQASVRHFCEIFKNYEDQLKDASDNDFNLRLAISISLGYSREEMTGFWIASNKDKTAVTRYETYQKLVASGKMDQGGDTNDHRKWSTEEFKNLPIPLMRLVVDSRLNDDEMEWLVDYALSKKADGKNQFDAYNYITYTAGYNYENPELFKEENKDKYNTKYGNFLNYYNDYGTKDVYRLWMIFEEGSVCGGLAQTYSALAEVFGRPSSPSGQPGHAASLTYQWNKDNGRYEWVIQNNISGWMQTNNQYEDRVLRWGNQSWAHYHSGGVYTVLATDCILDKNYVEVTLLNLLAESYDDNNDKVEVYEKALKLQPKNLDSMEGLINCYLNDETKESKDFFNLSKRVIETYTYYPKVMMEVLTLLVGKVTNTSEIAQLDVLKHNALLKSSKATPEESSNVGMSKQTANAYLNDNQSTELATFSFDGENANKIMIDSKYNGTDIRVRYSLDGGKTWNESNDHEILLTKEQLSTITAENDIIVGLVGASDDLNHRIDILEGRKITSSTVILNDYENLLLGEVANLEFSLDGGETWCDYIVGNEESINPNNMTGIRIEGSQTVKVRYKANGLYLQSEEVEFVFTENADTDNKKYVQLKNVNVVDASDHQGGRNPELMIDGKIESGYHTKFGTTTNDKFFIVEFAQPKYISSMDYVFTGGNNGRLKSGEIQASLDGEKWETIKTFSNMPRNVESQAYDMDLVVKAKYIKIVATETHGNQSGEANMYLAGKELRFYEDATMVDDEPTNGIENLKDLDKELQEKVDSLIAEVVMTEIGLSLDITGDNEDLVHVNEIEITEEGIFAIVEDKKLKFGVALDGLELDITNTRALRIAEANKYSAVPHINTNESLKITSSNFENILITSKVAEPFVDVEDKHWFKGEVEEAFNYAFTLGTSATTFEPNKQITRGEFAVMIARALELKPDGSKEQFKDINGKWYKNEVQALKDAGIVNGFVDGTFGGDKTITRQEAATMLVNMLKYANVDTTTKSPANLVDMDKVGTFAKPAVQFLAEKGVLSGNQNKEFMPLNNLTRAEMAKILVKSLKLTDLY